MPAPPSPAQQAATRPPPTAQRQLQRLQAVRPRLPRKSRGGAARSGAAGTAAGHGVDWRRSRARQSAPTGRRKGSWNGPCRSGEGGGSPGSGRGQGGTGGAAGNPVGSALARGHRGSESGHPWPGGGAAPQADTAMGFQGLGSSFTGKPTAASARALLARVSLEAIAVAGGNRATTPAPSAPTVSWEASTLILRRTSCRKGRRAGSCRPS